MYLQLIRFDGPRDAELVEASRRAGEDRVGPLILSDPGLRDRLLGGVRAVGPDGTEMVVVLAADEAALDDLGRIVMSSELLPGEDPALLPGPDHVERFANVDVFGPLASMPAGAGR